MPSIVMNSCAPDALDLPAIHHHQTPNHRQRHGKLLLADRIRTSSSADPSSANRCGIGSSLARYNRRSECRHDRAIPSTLRINATWPSPMIVAPE